MRKVIVVLMVLSMASVASAALHISVNGDKMAYEVTVEPSGTLSLGIWTDCLISPGLGEWAGWALTTQITSASISGGISIIQDPGIDIFDDAAGSYGFPLPVGENGVGGMLILFELSSIPTNATIFDEIVYHCKSPGDITLNLYVTEDFVNYTLMNYVTIHQLVPEPMTLGLLGIGAALLRRRK